MRRDTSTRLNGLRTKYSVRNKSMLSDEMITKYQGLVKQRFNREISREEALENGAKLLRLVELIYKPMTEDEYKQLQERRRETSGLTS